jgi:hypothetical protein
MIIGRLFLIGLIYGVGFMVVKSLFPEPFVLLLFQTGDSSEGNLTLVSLVYMGSGLLAGLVTAPIFGAFIMRGRESRRVDTGSQTPRFVLSITLALSMGVVSGLLIMLAYATGLLQSGGVLDPLAVIGASNFPSGTPLLVVWTIARDLLPAGLAGLFLAPLAGGMLHKLYTKDEGPIQKEYDWPEE